MNIEKENISTEPTETIEEVKENLINGDVNDKEKEIKRELEDLRKVLNKCKESSMLASVKKFMKRIDGGYNAADMNQCACNATVDFYIKDGLFYATITNKDEGSTAISELRLLWNRVMKRSTEQNLNGEDEDYNLVIDFINNEVDKGLVYTISFFQPMYLLFEDKNIVTLISEAQDVNYGIESISQEELEEDDYEEEYKENNYTQFNDNDSIIGNHNILG